MPIGHLHFLKVKWGSGAPLSTPQLLSSTFTVHTPALAQTHTRSGLLPDMTALLPLFSRLLIATFLLSFSLLSLAGDCPLEFTWANFTSAGSACNDPSQLGNCCRYINAYVAISVARYANSTGKLGVPPAFSDLCLTAVAETFQLYGIPQSATESCGVGPKIRVTYQCDGRGTVLEMMQSPGFTEVISNCQVPVSSEVGCKTCLNSGILYLHRLIGTDDNVALSVCRDAVFATLSNQGDSLSSDDDMASCFFGVGGLSTTTDRSSEGTTKPTQSSSPNLTAASPPTQKSIDLFSKKPHLQHQAFHLSLIPGIGIGIILISVILLLILMALIRRKSMELKNVKSPNKTLSWGAFSQPQLRRGQDGPSQMFRRYSYMETKIATNNFSTEIGKGGFGTVFEARFSDGSVAAVKRMDKVSKQGEEEFCQEIELLARLHHRHLVSLKGFCVEGQERFLVYEYMANGSLKDHLHSSGQKALRWETRLRIAIDVANALEYLHFYCNPPLCHRDIKSSNILLDKNFVAKVADFGLAHASRSGTISFEPVSTDIRGTPGYMDPEYVVSQELTEKSDIYSYGVLLLELVTGRRAIQDNRNLVEWAQKYMASEEMVPEMVDPTIRDSCDMYQLHMVVGVVRCCTQREGKARPSIKQVLRVYSEKLDPVYEDADGRTRVVRGSIQGKEPIPHSGDARSLQSSSSTIKSYCSRSILLESGGSPQSPHTLLSL